MNFLEEFFMPSTFTVYKITCRKCGKIFKAKSQFTFLASFFASLKYWLHKFTCSGGTQT